MAREQLGICAEANLHGSYLLLNVLEGHERVLRYKLAQLPPLFDRLAEHFSESMLTGVVAIGSNFWDLYSPQVRPASLQAFPELNLDNVGLAPVPIDLLIQIRSDRLDVNVIACQQVLQTLQGHVELQEQWQGFRYLDGRNLSGFIDAPYNPPNRLKRQSALVSAEVEPVFNSGSYVYLQCMQFDYHAWQQLSLMQQQEIMGYDKVSGKALDPALLHGDSHYVCMQGESAYSEVLMQNMPFYQFKRQGLIQLGYAATAEALQQQLSKRLGLAAHDSGPDALLNYLRIELSAAFFAPSISFLELSARQ